MSTILDDIFYYTYQGNAPANLSGAVFFNFDAYVATGTFGPATINQAVLFGGPDFTSVVDPASFIILEHGHVTDWSITMANPDGHVFMFTSPARDYIQLGSSYTSVENSPGAWTSHDYRAPGPEVGAGLLPLILLAAFLIKRGVTQ